MTIRNCCSRLAAFALVIALLLSALPMAPAHAISMWENLAVSVVTYDAYGNEVLIPAQAVPGSEEHAYWFTLDPALLGATLTVRVEYPDPAYTFYFMDYTLNHLWLQDAESLDNLYAQYIGYSVGDITNYRGLFPVYFSTRPMPVEDAVQSEVLIPVVHLTEEGMLLDEKYVRAYPGQSVTISANARSIGDYILTSSGSVDVYVDAAGHASPERVVFYYRLDAASEPAPAPTSAPVVDVPDRPDEEEPMSSYGYITGSTVNLREGPSANAKKIGEIKRYGYCLVLDTTRSGGVTWYNVYINDQTGYVHGDYFKQLTVAEADAFVRSEEYQQGLRNNQPAPTEAPVQSAVIPVYYMHVDGRTLDFYELTLEPGSHAVQANSRAVKGLRCITDEVVYVNVDRYGAADQPSVYFYYEDAVAETSAPVQAELTVIYRLEDGTVLDTQYQYLSEGSHVIYPGSSRVGDYELTGTGHQEVYADRAGRVSPNPVVFEYRLSSARITIHYQDEWGRDVAPAQTRTLVDGTHTIKAAPEGLDAQYELAPGLHTSVEVTVRGGVASQSDVYFYYRKAEQAPSYATVTVHYYDMDGREIVPAQTKHLEPGQHRLTPDTTLIPAGYELASAGEIPVDVYENGTSSSQEVAFYYREKDAEPQKAEVILYFKDSQGREIADSRREYLGNGTHVLRPEAGDIPAGYELLPGTKAEEEVTVRNGKANRTQITFYFQQTVTAPAVHSIPVYYHDEAGMPIADTQYAQVEAGVWNIRANPENLPAGYTLKGADTLTVTVYEDGSTSPAVIIFTYKAPVQSALVPVYISDGQRVIAQYTEELSGGMTHLLTVNPAHVPSGYDADSAQTVTVQVNKDGFASPDTVTFYVEKLVVETPIPVGTPVYRYATITSGKVAFRAEPSTSGGNKTVIKRFGKGDVVFVLQESYNADGVVWAMLNVDGRIGYTSSEYLQIMTQAASDRYAAGSTPVPTFTPVPTASPTPTASPSPTPSEAPLRQAVIPVYYYHVNGTLLDMYEVTLDPGVHYISQNSPAVTELSLVSDAAVQVIVFQDGAADRANVVFYYEDVAPVETATPTASPTPFVSPTPTPYVGYALTTRSTALRTGISSSDMSIIHNMEANELVLVSSQLQDPLTGEIWSIVTTMRGQYGYMLNAALRYINQKEAQPYLDMWEQINASPVPTTVISPSPEPMQVQGYGVAIGDHVPFRQMASDHSRIIDNLARNTVVYISGQTWVNNTCWHSVTYDGAWGYVRGDLVRLMTIAEEDAYLESLFTPAPTMATTNQPFDENGLSSYGYINASSVNLRAEPSTSAKRLGEIKRYGYCLVLGTQNVGGVTWYNIYYNEQIGYVHGDFFEHLTIAEAEAFKASEEYRQGVRNNTASSTEDEGYTGLGGSVSAEDILVNEWLDPNSGAQVSYAPYVPTYNTPQPVNTPTLEPLPGVTSVPAATPTPTFNPLPSVTYPTSTETGNGGNPVVWVAVIMLLLMAAGGVFIIVRYQQKRRRIAMRAAQRRAMAARAQQRPYARQGNPGQPRTGAYPGQPRRPADGQPTGQYTPYPGTYGGYRSGAPATQPDPDDMTGSTRRTQPLPPSEDEDE